MRYFGKKTWKADICMFVAIGCLCAVIAGYGWYFIPFGIVFVFLFIPSA